MKYFVYFLLFTSGFLFHKVANEIYDYNWIKAWQSEACRKVYNDALNDPNNKTPLASSFGCAEKKMGISYYLVYIIA